MTHDEYENARDKLSSVAGALAELRPVFSNPLALPEPRKLHEAEVAVHAARCALEVAWKRCQPWCAQG